MDLHMLILLGSAERTAAEFEALLGGSGFEVRRVLRSDSPTGLSVIECAPFDGSDAVVSGADAPAARPRARPGSR